MGRRAVIPLVRKLFTDERGSQIIEFLMIIPAVLILVLCMGEFGRAAYCKIALQSAVRDGARLAALNAPRFEVENAVRRSAGSVPIDRVEITRNSVGIDSTSMLGQGDVSVRLTSHLELKSLAKLGVPEHLRQFRMQAEAQVPMVK